MSTAFQTIAIIGKYKTPEIVVPVLSLAEFLAAQGYTVVLDSLTAENAKGSPYRALPLEEMGQEIDLAVVLGGDGTLLNIARTLAPHHIPLIGVNQGRIGFLTDLSLETMKKTLAAMLKGNYVSEERLLLQAAVVRDKREVFHGLAFNEVVVHRSNVSSMVEFEVRIDGEYLYNQRADGLIISTPTGSTAYALSSGGPILHPSLDVLELVPVCPHSLSNRPLVVKGSSVMELLMHRNGDIHVRYDSHSHVDLQLHDKVIVSRYHQPVLLLHPEGHSYYHTLREKLLWTQTL